MYPPSGGQRINPNGGQKPQRPGLVLTHLVRPPVRVGCYCASWVLMCYRGARVCIGPARTYSSRMSSLSSPNVRQTQQRPMPPRWDGNLAPGSLLQHVRPTKAPPTLSCRQYLGFATLGVQVAQRLMADRKLLTSLAVALGSIATYTAIQLNSPEVRPCALALMVLDEPPEMAHIAMRACSLGLCKPLSQLMPMTRGEANATGHLAGWSLWGASLWGAEHGWACGGRVDVSRRCNASSRSTATPPSARRPRPSSSLASPQQPAEPRLGWKARRRVRMASRATGTGTGREPSARSRRRLTMSFCGAWPSSCVSWCVSAPSHPL